MPYQPHAQSDLWMCRAAPGVNAGWIINAMQQLSMRAAAKKCCEGATCPAKRLQWASWGQLRRREIKPAAEVQLATGKINFKRGFRAVLLRRVTAFNQLRGASAK